MNHTGTILKAMQAVLLMTVLTPAISHADPLSTRMMLAQAQTQSQDKAVSGEVKKLNRGLILGTAEAATPSNVQRPVEIPQVTVPVVAAPVVSTPVATIEAPQIEIPRLPPRNDDTPATNNTFSTAAAPAAATSTTPSVVTLPAPQPSDTAAITTATTDVATTPAVTPVQPVTVAPVTTAAPTATAATSAMDTAKTEAVTTSSAKADTVTAKPTRTAQVSHPHRASTHSDDSVNVGGVKLNAGNLSGQLNKIMNRSDVRSILSQYGLN